MCCRHHMDQSTAFQIILVLHLSGHSTSTCRTTTLLRGHPLCQAIVRYRHQWHRRLAYRHMSSRLLTSSSRRRTSGRPWLRLSWAIRGRVPLVQHHILQWKLRRQPLLRRQLLPLLQRQLLCCGKNRRYTQELMNVNYVTDGAGGLSPGATRCPRPTPTEGGRPARRLRWLALRCR